MFLGKWTLDVPRSKVFITSDLKPLQWRTYERDGDRVKVAWGNANGQLGAYSARCDGTVEAAEAVKVRCWLKSTNTIEGEQLDPGDTIHRYYRRVVSRDGRKMTITWYEDPKHRRAMERFQYSKQ